MPGTVTSTDVHGAAAPTVRAVCWHCPQPKRGKGEGGGEGKPEKQKREHYEQTLPTTSLSTQGLEGFIHRAVSDM